MKNVLHKGGVALAVLLALSACGEKEETVKTEAASASAVSDSSVVPAAADNSNASP